MMEWIKDAFGLVLLCAMCALFALYGEAFTAPVYVGNMLVGG